MSMINITNDIIHSYPLWYFINDILVILINIIAIVVATLFICTVVHLDHPTYSVSSLFACKTCLAIGLVSLTVLLNHCYALASDFRGVGYKDPLCILRGILFSMCYVNMYTSLCLKALNRLRCIVHHIPPTTKSYRSLLMLTTLQWLFVAILVLPMVLTNGIDYDWGSHLCLVTIEKPWQFKFLIIIYYISIIFISSVYLYILYYVFHLSPLEQHHGKRQVALLRRILTLLCMLIIPGLFHLILILNWTFFHSIPSYSFKLNSLLSSIGYTGTVITIFISNTRLRHEYYKKQKKQIHKEHLQLLRLQQQPRRKF